MLDRIKSEPAIVGGLVQAVLGLLLAFGVNLSNEQTGAILAVTAAVLALVVRSKVQPVSDEPGEDGTSAVNVLLIVVLVLVILALLGHTVQIR